MPTVQARTFDIPLRSASWTPAAANPFLNAAMPATMTMIADHGIVGVAVNGIEFTAGKVAWEFDSCMGHTDKAARTYHYHMSPVCLYRKLGIAVPSCPTWWRSTDPVSFWPARDTHASPIVGWALDGNAIFGPYGSDGMLITAASGMLDECNGYTDPVTGTYRYVLTPDAPYLPKCFRDPIAAVVQTFAPEQPTTSALAAVAAWATNSDNNMSVGQVCPNNACTDFVHDVQIDGWLTDLQCWRKVLAPDGAIMNVNPIDHTVWCLLLPVCIESNYGIIDPTLKTLSYRFHPDSLRMAEQWIRALESDVKNNIQVRVRGVADKPVEGAGIAGKTMVGVPWLRVSSIELIAPDGTSTPTGTFHANVGSVVDALEEEVSSTMDDDANLSAELVIDGRTRVFQRSTQLTGFGTLAWSVDGDTLTMAAVAKANGGWVSVAFSNGGDQPMVGAEAVLGWADPNADTNMFVGGWILGGKSSGTVQLSPERLALKTAEVYYNADDESTTIVFSRSVSESQTVSGVPIDIDTSNTLLWATGSAPALAADGSVASRVSYHSFRQYGSINYATGSVTTADAPSVKKMHAWVMSIAYLVCFPVGAFIARFFKPTIGSPLWFKMHRVIQCVGIGLSVWGFCLAVFDFAQQGHSTHMWLGYFVCISAWLQPLNAFLRPHVDCKLDVQSMARRVWKMLHSGLGWFAVIGGVVNVVYGFAALDDQHQTGTDGVTAVKYYGGFLAIAALALEVRRYLGDRQPKAKTLDEEKADIEMAADKAPMVAAAAATTTLASETDAEQETILVDLTDVQ